MTTKEKVDKLMKEEEIGYCQALLRVAKEMKLSTGEVEERVIFGEKEVGNNGETN